MSELELHSLVATHAFYLELEKIALHVDPMHVARLSRETADLADKAGPDLWQKMRPGTGSFFGAVKDKWNLHRAKGRVKSEAQSRLSHHVAANSTQADNILDEQERLRGLGRVRQAEQELHGPGFRGRPAQQGAYGGIPMPQATQGQRSTIRNLAFGTGIGAAGILGAQHYMNQQQAPPGYQ